MPGKKKGTKMSLNDFLGPPPAPEVVKVEVDSAPLSSDPLLRYSSYFTTDGDCHAYYAGDESVWDVLVAQGDWTRVGAMFHHIATILERDKEREEKNPLNHPGSWGTHPTFMQFMQTLWRRLQWLHEKGFMTPEIKAAARRLFDVANPEFTMKQTSRIPKFGNKDLMTDCVP